jgi:class 3 adenylate cyclase/tetratricopeptide (TPR) repeat protein
MSLAPGEEQRCADCGELSPARAKFCMECGTKFHLVDRLPQATGSDGERRIVSVLFADLSGFTAYSEDSDVEDVRTIAQETATQLGDIVVRYGGTVDKIIGDCVMAVWGAPAAHEDDPERAVRAALDMQACVEENRARFAGLALCVGIQTGEAMWSPVGADGRYTVLGDTVNTAARLQGAAAKGEVIIGAPTYQAVADVIDCELLEPIKAKNKTEPVPAWRAVAVTGVRTKHRAVVATLAGREAESGRLRELWEHAKAENRTYGVTLIGAPGVGKSRLVATLTDSIGSNALVLRGRCLPYGEGITYWPVIEIIQEAADIRHDDDRETISHKLGAMLESLGSDDLDELRTMAVALANLIGAPATPRGTYTATEISQGELHWGLRRILELGARTAGAVLVIEDLHWAEPTLLELLAFIADSPGGAPVLAIGTARPEFKEAGGEYLKPSPTRRVLELDALTDDACRQIVTELLGTDLPTASQDELLRAAGGNPLFLEEIAQVWRETEGDARAIAKMPSGLQALIDSRLDKLPPLERRIVTHASVVGDTFWTGTIAYLEGGDEGLADALDSLERRDLVRSLSFSTVTGQQEYVFKHGLIRDAAYRRLTKTERVELHRRCGAWIGELPTGQDEFAEIIAYHLEQACRLATDLALTEATVPMLDAVRALSRAGEKAEAREGMREAERFFARAIDLLDGAYPETANEAKLRRARILTGLGRIDDATVLMHEVAEDAVALDRPDLRCRAVISLAEIDVQTGAAADARVRVDEGERLARELGDTSLRIKAMQIRATVRATFDGHSASAIEGLQSAIALAEEVGDMESALYARLRLGAMYFNAGELEPALLHFSRCDEIARVQGSLRVQSWLTAMLGLLHHHRGPRAEADALFARAAEWMERTNDPYMRAQTLLWHATAMLAEGDTTRALKALRTAEDIAKEIGGPLLVNVASAMTETLARLGRSAEAREMAALARREAPAEDPLTQASVLLAEGFASASDGDEATARRAFAQAFPILENQGQKVDLGEARLRFATLLASLGDVTTATDQLERAREIFVEIDANATVDAIEQEMARLRDAELGATGSLKT